jgi:hypothetical protein
MRSPFTNALLGNYSAHPGMFSPPPTSGIESTLQLSRLSQNADPTREAPQGLLAGLSAYRSEKK